MGADDAFGFLLADFAEAFEEFFLSGWEPAAEAAALAGGKEVDELVHGHALEFVQFESAVGEFFDHDRRPHC